MQDKHRSIDAIFVQYQLVGLSKSRYDPFLRRVDEGTNGLGTAWIIGREDWLFAQGWGYVILELCGILCFSL